MKIEITKHKLRNENRFLTLLFSFNEMEYQQLINNTPSESFTQLTTETMEKSFFKKEYHTKLISSVASKDVNPFMVRDELNLLKTINLITDDKLKQILNEYCTEYCKRNPNINLQVLKSYFGAGFLDDQAPHASK